LAKKKEWGGRGEEIELLRKEEKPVFRDRGRRGGGGAEEEKGEGGSSPLSTVGPRRRGKKEI